MDKLNQDSKDYLLKIARDSIESVFGHKELDFGEVPETVKQPRGVFVTLTIDGELRGCIGNLEPQESIFEAVAQNARNAAFHDPRFMPLTKEEFDSIKIEISVLSESKMLPYLSAGDLCNKLSTNKPGVIIQAGLNKATFLPQVWEDLPDPAQFLSQLCLKAGLLSEYWRGRDSDLIVRTYEVDNFSE